jgi:hypothetical protein
MKDVRFLTFVLSLLLGVALTTAPATAQPPDADARRTRAAERREEISQMSPEERAQWQAERRARHRKDDENRPPRPIEIRAPLPLPVKMGPVGKPAGGACAKGESCTLELTPSSGEVLVVTAVWSADEIQCDEIKSSTPPGGQPISPQWRCERLFRARGTGAAYTGFTVAE